MHQTSDPPHTYPEKFVLAAVGGEDEEAINMAKDYVKRMKLTSDDVKIVRDDGSILVVTKRKVTLQENL